MNTHKDGVLSMLDLNLIRIDGGTQARVALNQDTVSEYAEAYRQGAEFPPVIVFFDGADRWLADGFHRYFGAVAAGLTQIREKVTPGTKRDAVLYSLNANATHGLRRTNADKRKAVETLLADAEWAEWSDREIAKQCGVGHPFVAAIRNPAIAAKQQAHRDANTSKKSEATLPVQTKKMAEGVESDSTHKPVMGIGSHDPEPEDDGPDDAEIAAMEAAAHADMLAMEQLFEADDKLGEAFAEIKRLNAEVAQLRASRDGYMNKSNELISTIKKLQRQLDKLKAAA